MLLKKKRKCASQETRRVAVENESESEPERAGREPRIGAKFQAVLPALRSRKCKRLRNRSDLADIFYRCVESVHGELVIRFVRYAEAKFGYTFDDALHVLHCLGHNLDASIAYVQRNPKAEIWSKAEQIRFTVARAHFGKKFRVIKLVLPNKTMRDIIQRFYWSKHKDLKLSLMDDRIRKKMRPYDRKYDENVEPSERIFPDELTPVNYDELGRIIFNTENDMVAESRIVNGMPAWTRNLEDTSESSSEEDIEYVDDETYDADDDSEVEISDYSNEDESNNSADEFEINESHGLLINKTHNISKSENTEYELVENNQELPDTDKYENFKCELDGLEENSTVIGAQPTEEALNEMIENNNSLTPQEDIVETEHRICSQVSLIEPQYFSCSQFSNYTPQEPATSHRQKRRNSVDVFVDEFISYEPNLSGDNITKTWEPFVSNDEFPCTTDSVMKAQNTSSQMDLTDIQGGTNTQSNTERTCSSQTGTITKIIKASSQSEAVVPLGGSPLIDTGLIQPSSTNYAFERDYTDDYSANSMNLKVEHIQTDSFGYVESCHILPHLPKYEVTPPLEHLAFESSEAAHNISGFQMNDDNSNKIITDSMEYNNSYSTTSENACEYTVLPIYVENVDDHNLTTPVYEGSSMVADDVSEFTINDENDSRIITYSLECNNSYPTTSGYVNNYTVLPNYLENINDINLQTSVYIEGCEAPHVISEFSMHDENNSKIMTDSMECNNSCHMTSGYVGDYTRLPTYLDNIDDINLQTSVYIEGCEATVDASDDISGFPIHEENNSKVMTDSMECNNNYPMTSGYACEYTVLPIYVENVDDHNLTTPVYEESSVVADDVSEFTINDENDSRIITYSLECNSSYPTTSGYVNNYTVLPTYLENIDDINLQTSVYIEGSEVTDDVSGFSLNDENNNKIITASLEFNNGYPMPSENVNNYTVLPTYFENNDDINLQTSVYIEGCEVPDNVSDDVSRFPMHDENNSKIITDSMECNNSCPMTSGYVGDYTGLPYYLENIDDINLLASVYIEGTEVLDDVSDDVSGFPMHDENKSKTMTDSMECNNSCPMTSGYVGDYTGLPSYLENIDDINLLASVYIEGSEISDDVSGDISVFSMHDESKSKIMTESMVCNNDCPMTSGIVGDYTGLPSYLENIHDINLLASVYIEGSEISDDVSVDVFDEVSDDDSDDFLGFPMNEEDNSKIMTYSMECNKRVYKECQEEKETPKEDFIPVNQTKLSYHQRYQLPTSSKYLSDVVYQRRSGSWKNVFSKKRFLADESSFENSLLQDYSSNSNSSDDSDIDDFVRPPMRKKRNIEIEPSSSKKLKTHNIVSDLAPTLGAHLPKLRLTSQKANNRLDYNKHATTIPTGMVIIRSEIDNLAETIKDKAIRIEILRRTEILKRKYPRSVHDDDDSETEETRIILKKKKPDIFGNSLTLEATVPDPISELLAREEDLIDKMEKHTTTLNTFLKLNNQAKECHTRRPRYFEPKLRDAPIPIPTPVYQIKNEWEREEILMVKMAVEKFGLDYKRIASLVGNKTETDVREYLEILEEDLVARAEKLDKKGQLRNAEMEKRIKTLFNPETRILDVDIQEKYRVLFESGYAATRKIFTNPYIDSDDTGSD